MASPKCVYCSRLVASCAHCQRCRNCQEHVSLIIAYPAAKTLCLDNPADWRNLRKRAEKWTADKAIEWGGIHKYRQRSQVRQRRNAS